MKPTEIEGLSLTAMERPPYASKASMVDRIGNCRIVGEIGSGGMAVIYKAVQEPLEREVAVKALKPSIALDSQFAARFEREARFMASLQHENILHVYDFVKDGHTMYIIMEYVQGIDLYDLLQLSPRLPIEVSAIIALQVARALDYAHFRGLIHRDIKPANVIISYHGEVKLMDFGIARDETLSDLTEAGTGVGTPSYMSPEQILGDKLDFRSDMFSLGIVLFQMLTGRKPFLEDDSRTVMQKIRLDRYTSPRKIVSSIPRALEHILARCMEKMPANRYPTTQALIDDLMEFLAPRVPINYNARLVMYLRDVGVIPASDAEAILAAGSGRSARAGRGDPALVRSVAAVSAVLLGGVLVSGGVIQASHGQLASSEETAGQIGTPVIPDKTGYLKFVVEPWAEVFIDGYSVATTPTAARIPVAPGKHYVKLANPFYREESFEVTIKAGDTRVIERDLEPRHGTEPSGQAGAPEAAAQAEASDGEEVSP